MGKKFQFDLFKDDVDDLIEEIVIMSYFEEKVQDFITALANIGISRAEEVMSTAVGDAKGVTFSLVRGEESQTVSIVMTGQPTEDGQGNSAIFWEFGAGIKYNHTRVSTNPLSHKFEAETGISTDIGSYPGKYKDAHGHSQGSDPGYWKTPEGVISEGTKAMMPMFNASQTMIVEIDEVARRVFMEC